MGYLKMYYNNLQKETKNSKSSRNKLTTLLASLTIVCTGLLSLSGLQEPKLLENEVTEEIEIVNNISNAIPASTLVDYTQFNEDAISITANDGLTYYITNELIEQAENDGVYNSLYGVPADVIYQAANLQNIE